MAAYSRKVLLINKRFQFRFSFYVCSWLILLSLAYPLIISNLFDYFLQYLASDPMGPGLATLERTRQDIFTLLLLMQAVLLGVAFFISIFMSHKIAGPIYKLRKFFLEAKAGNIEQELRFRKKDYFMELVPAYNEMMESIRNRLGRKQQGIDVAIQNLEKALKQVNPEIRREFKGLKEIEDTLVQLKEAQNS